MAQRLLTKRPLRLFLVLDARVPSELGLHLSKTVSCFGNTTTPFESVTYRAVNCKFRESKLYVFPLISAFYIGVSREAYLVGGVQPFVC